MDKHRTNALQYGHLGTAVYVPDAQAWEFSRRVEKGSPLSLVGRSEITIPPSMKQNVANGPQNTSGDRLKQTATLLKVCPELASSSRYLLENEVSSRAITAAISNFQPGVSKLLSLGNATYVEGTRRYRTIPIAVFAWGESATTLKFVPLENKVTGEISPDIHRANLPCLGNQESGWWTGNGASVRQICFSETIDETSTWMAVRFPCSSRIFRPLYHKMAVPASYRGDELGQNIFPNSRLDPNPLLNIPISLTGGYAHADVTFNPWYQHQFALVDDRGNWSIWEIQGKSRQKGKSKWRADMSSTGSLLQPCGESKENISDQEHYDSWAAINWVGDINRLLVCDRRNIVLYRINCDPMKQYRVNLGLERNSEWILDVKRSPSNQSHVFVLTSSKIFWLNVVSDDELFGHHEDEGLNVSILLSWRHFRGQEDTSLQLSLFNNGKDDISLTLYSRLNLLVQTFRFSSSSEDPSIPISVSDPSLLPLPLELERQAGSEDGGRELHLSSLAFQDVEHTIISRREGAALNTRMVKMFAQSEDLGIVEALYLLPVHHDQQDDEMVLDNQTMLAPRKLRRVKSNRSITAMDDDLDDFIVDDRDESTLNSGLGQYWKARNAKLSTQYQRPLSATDQGILDFNSVYSSISRLTNSTGGKNGDEGFSATLQMIKQTIQESTTDDLITSLSLLDIAASAPTLNDIDQNANEFQHFMDSFLNEVDGVCQYRPFKVDTHYPFNRIRNPAASFDALPQPDITLLYDSLVQDWLAPLPADVSNRIRIAKEKLIRNIAAELSLARVVIFRAPDEGIAQAGKGHSRASSQPNMLQDYKFPPTSQMSEYGVSSSFGPNKSSSLPGTPSSSQPPQLPSQDSKGTPYSRLRLYTSIHEQPPLSKSVSNLLAHWQPGSDPSTYDWQKTAQALDVEEAQEERMKRSTSKRKKRENSRRARSQSQTQLSGPTDSFPPSSSVPVVRTFGGQPQGKASMPIVGVPQSSQVTEMFPSSQFPSSQFERGVLSGGEVGAKARAKGKAKKKRAAGF